MGSIKTNGGGKAGGDTLTVIAPINVTITISKDDKSFSKNSGETGIAVFKGLEAGTWAVTITDGTEVQTDTVEVGSDNCVMSFKYVPVFNYTGEYEIVDDNDQPIVEAPRWKIRFLTSGTLTFSDLVSAVDGIDVFIVGGGAGGSGGGPMDNLNWNGPGGGSGYTCSEHGVAVSTTESYTITIGGGGSKGNAKGDGGNGGASYAFGFTANGGKKASFTVGPGGDGGSGGGGQQYPYNSIIDGGEDGSDGKKGYHRGGYGQKTTTREFGESDKKLYATGGYAGRNYDPINNTGNGGDGAPNQTSGKAGSSGIVIIRKHREAVTA